MRARWSAVAVAAALTMANASATGEEARLRPPAVPLVAHDPYFSIWSHADRLTDAPTRHWTGRPHRLCALVRIGARTYRLLGSEPEGLPALPQVALDVTPTRTLAAFEGDGVRVELDFVTPALPNDLDLLARPVTYVALAARAVDGADHAVALHFDASPEIAVNDPGQEVVCDALPVAGLAAWRAGTVEQPLLQKRGDDLRIDWGWLLVAAPEGDGLRKALVPADAVRGAFALGQPPPSGAGRATAPAREAPVLALGWDLKIVGARPAERWLMVGYDDVRSIRWFGQDLRPYWRRKGMDAAGLLRAAARDWPALRRRCEAFDAEITADLTRVGGARYAAMAALAYRQCLAGCKLAADEAGAPLLFPKENTSNGCIATVDVIYPMAPLFLALSPSLARAMLQPVLAYAASPRWKFPFAPHDLGTYPHATGQVYGGGERSEENQMPVEESGNMLILLAALARVEGDAGYAARWRPLLRRWAEYLREKGMNPANQLCTDDFAGHLAQNVNLSAKAIVALGAYARLCELWGDRAEARRYAALARDFAARWVREADDGDRFRLAFDRPGTWSQKYNLVWDRILGLGLFPGAVLEKEMAFYRKRLNRYGLPLDSRQPYAKTDWSVWTATLTGSRNDFDAIVGPVLDYVHETPDRQPLNDWYWTTTGREVGMHARPVVGGVFLPLLRDAEAVRRYTARDRKRPARWAPLPPRPEARAVVPAADAAPAVWRFTTEEPGGAWMAPGYDDSTWREGRSGFGAAGTPGAVVNTPWTTPRIWLRRAFDLPESVPANLALWVHHDEDAEVYLNGVLAARLSGYTVEYVAAPIAEAALRALRPGRNTLAVACRQTTGGQAIDVGLVSLRAR